MHFCMSSSAAAHLGCQKGPLKRGRRYFVTGRRSYILDTVVIEVLPWARSEVSPVPGFSGDFFHLAVVFLLVPFSPMSVRLGSATFT